MFFKKSFYYQSTIYSSIKHLIICSSKADRLFMPYCTISCYKYSQNNLNKYEEKIIKKKIASINYLETHFWIKIKQTSHIHRLLHAILGILEILGILGISGFNQTSHIHRLLHTLFPEYRN